MSLVTKSESFNLKDNPAATLAPATTRHREFSLTLEDKVEAINRIKESPHTPQQSPHFNQQTQSNPNQ